MPVPEARIERRDGGLVATSEGWYVINLGEARWMSEPTFGTWSDVETEESAFPEFGIGVHVLQPGQPNGLYHGEQTQEAFLVLGGECICIIENEERRLGPWDFVHCPAGTEHIFVGAGDGPCAILMAGGRGAAIRYPVNEVAARHGASAVEETDSPREAYAPFEREFVPAPPAWPPAGG